MGIFSAADIVVFVLCLFMCVSFYLMGNSKRLEKVKKYGEKLMGEMKALADSAKEPLENFKIDLEVEAKAAEQLLLRLKDVRVTIIGYEETVKHIEERLTQFQASLAGLDRESAAVAENLARIHDESVFADGLSAKIVSARKRFDALEREIGHLKESMLGAFEKTNAEKLEQSTSALLDAARKTAAALQNEVEQKITVLARTAGTARENVEAHLALIQKAEEEQQAAIEASKKEIIRLAEDAVKNAGEHSGEYEAQVFRQLGEAIDEKAGDLREKMDSDWKAIQKASEENRADISALSEENRAAIANLQEEIENAQAGVRDAISRTVEKEETLWQEKLDEMKRAFDLFSGQTADLEARVKAMREQVDGTTERTEEVLRASLENAVENAGKLGDEKFDTYRAALEEKIARLDTDADKKLCDVNDSLSGMIESLNTLMQTTGGEIRESVAAIKAGTDKAQADIESLTAEFEALKKEATATLNGEISALEESIRASLHEKIERLKSMQETECLQFDAKITEKYRAVTEETDEKWSSEFERLRETLEAFENTLRAEMHSADENLGVFRDNMEQNVEELRKNTGAVLKSEIEKITRETNESLHASRRDFEDGLKILATDVQNRIESVQAVIEETSEKSGEMLQTAHERLETTAQKIASLDAEIQDAQKKMADFSEQTKLFGEADNLKVELEHKIEAMKTDIERLVHEKNALAGMEMQFEKILRMEEETSVKITRFLAEQKRIDIMESNFNRLVKMSGDIEEKLRNISEENDMLEQVQVKLRKLYEAAEASEEKYQRVEKRNNIIETTSTGISANFKKLEDAELRIETHKADMASIEKELSDVKDALAKIRFENSEALKIATGLSTLDTSLAEIEERIDKMQTAREWLAGIETRMNEMYRNTVENLNRIDENAKRSLGGGTREKVDVLSPSLRDEVRRLKQEGWRVETIARNFGISEGAVQLILEISAR